MTTTENNVAAQAGDEPMREAFEAAYCKQYPVIAHISPDKFKRDEYGDYIENAIFVGWDMYRAGQVSPRATADVERVTITPELRRAVDMTRADLGESGSNYPAVRELLAFAESYIATTKPGA